MRAAPIALAAALAGCATSRDTGPAAHSPTPGFICRIGSGAASTSASTALRRDGTVYRSDWEWRHVRKWNSDFGLRISHGTGSHINPKAQSIAMLQYFPIDAMSAKRGQHQLALTNTPGEDYLVFHYAIAKSEKSKSAAGLYLALAWSDLQAFAKGSEQLFLVHRNVNTGKISSKELPIEIVHRAIREISFIQREMAELLANYRDRCDAVEDLDPQIILVGQQARIPEEIE